MSTLTPVGERMLRALMEGKEITCNWSGLGSGKTFAQIQAAHILCETRAIYDRVTRKKSPMRILITAESEPKLKANMLVQAQKYFQNVRGAHLNQDKGYTRYILENGSEIVFKAYKIYPNLGKCSIEGEEYAVIFSDETQELDESFYEISLDRARRPNVDLITGKEYMGQVVWSGRPQSDDTFLSEAKRKQDLGSSVEFIHCRSSSNPYLPTDYEKKQKRNCKSHDEWVAKCQIIPGATYPAEGAYYDNIDSRDFPEGNLIELSLDKTHPTIISYDPGNESASLLFWQIHNIEGEPKAIIVDEYHPSGFASEQDIVAYIKSRDYNLIEVIVDPYRGTQRSALADGDTTVRFLERKPNENPDGRGGGLGVRVTYKFPEVRKIVKEGIFRTAARISDVDNNKTILIRKELWESPTYDRGIKFSLQNFKPDEKTGQPDKTKSSGRASHCADALRYFVIEHLWDGPPGEGDAGRVSLVTKSQKQRDQERRFRRRYQ